MKVLCNVLTLLCFLTAFVISPSVHAQNESDPFRLVLQKGHGQAITIIQTDPSGAFLLTGDGKTVKIWETHFGQCIYSFSASYAAFLPDSRILSMVPSGSGLNRLSLLEFPSFKTMHSVVVKSSASDGVQWNSDSTALYLISNGGYVSDNTSCLINPNTLEVYTYVSSAKTFLIPHKNRIFNSTEYKTDKHRTEMLDYKGNVIWSKPMNYKRWYECKYGFINDQFFLHSGLYQTKPLVFSIEKGKKGSTSSHPGFELFEKKISSYNFHTSFDNNLHYFSRSREFKLLDYSGKEPEIIKESNQDYDITGKDWGDAKVHYAHLINNRILGVGAELFKVIDFEKKQIRYNKMRTKTSAFTLHEKTGKMYIGYVDGTFDVFDIETEKLLYSNQPEDQDLDGITDALFGKNGLILATHGSDFYDFGLSDFSLNKLENYGKIQSSILSKQAVKPFAFLFKSEFAVVKQVPSMLTSYKTKKYGGRDLVCINNKQTICALKTGNKVFLYDLTTGYEQELSFYTGNSEHTFGYFSPNDSSFLFIDGKTVYLVGLYSGKMFKANIPVPFDKPMAEPRWRPDGQKFMLHFFAAGKGLEMHQYAILSDLQLNYTTMKYQRSAWTDDSKYLLRSENGLKCYDQDGKTLLGSSDWANMQFQNDDKLYAIRDTQLIEFKLPMLTETGRRLRFNDNYQFKFRWVKNGDENHLISINADGISYFDIDNMTKTGEVNVPKTHYQNHIITSDGKYTIFYDHQWTGNLVVVNNDQKTYQQYGSGEIPLFATNYFNLDFVPYYSREMAKTTISEGNTSIQLNPALESSDKLLTYDRTGGLNIYDLEKNELLATIYLHGSNYMVITPDGYYSKSAEFNDLRFTKGKEAYSFEQFDLKYNRPDIILERLGFADEKMIDAYHRAYKKRLKKMKFTEAMLKSDFHIPELEIKNYEALPTITDSSKLSLNIEMKDGFYDLDRLNVWVNDVPVFGSSGISLRDRYSRTMNRQIQIPLIRGKNEIKLSVLNQAGAESFKKTVRVQCNSGKEKPDLYLVTIGESEFKNHTYDLTYAAKDANDIANTLRESKAFNRVFVKQPANREVTRENVLALKDFLNQGDINDEVMIFIAGHGVLDEKLDYYFATYDMDFNDPSKRGVPYEEFEALLDGIAPIRKLLLIDACHSGEIDKEEIALASAETVEVGDIQFRSVGNKKISNAGDVNTYELSKSLFGDLRKGVGATVISSAGGMEFAMEGDEWKNGLFTYCFLSGIKSNNADLDKNGEITISELKTYVSEQVNTLSKGLQKPTSRIENYTIDYRVW